MMDLLQLPVTLVVKAPNQKIADTRIDCDQQWTVKKLKAHLSDVYPSKPNENQQRIIYSGRLLQDDLILKDVLRHYNTEEPETVHTVHLVCSSSMENFTTTTPPSSSSSSPSISTTASSSESEGVRRRTTTTTTHQSSSSSSPSSSQPSSLPTTTTTATTPEAQSLYGAAGANPMYYGGYSMPATVPGMYTPEQMMWMQQMYAQQMAQYMQYMQQGGYMPDYSTGAAPATIPAATDLAANQQAAAAVAPPAPVANQQAANPGPIRMNAQGGPVLDEDDEEENRDWLDWVYTLSRFSVLISIVYFYSTLHRFVLVFGFFFMVYAYQAGWLGRRRARAANPPQQQQQQQQQQPEPQPQPEPEPQQQGINEDEADGAEEETGEAAPATEEAAPAPPPPPPPPSHLAVIWSFVSTFFTSLVPQQPAAVQAN